MIAEAGCALDIPCEVHHSPQVSTEAVLVGRETETERLREHLAGTLQGRGRLVFITGDAGLGKSRLAEGIARDAQKADSTVVWGRCWEAGGAPAFWPWRQALTGLSHALEAEPWARNQVLSAFMTRGAAAQEASAELAGLEPVQARFVLMESVHETLVEAARTRPLLVLLEDLHVADSASLSVLEFLEPLLRHTRVLIVATYRPAEMGLQTAVLRRTSQRVENMVLSPLGIEAVRAYMLLQVQRSLADETIRDVALLTEGNPLFLEEVTRVIARQPDASRAAMLTQNIYHIIQQRLSVHESEHVALLEIASVAGRDFRVSDLQSLSSHPESEIERALEHLVQGAALERVGLHAFRFTHILIREALYHRLEAKRRRSLHALRARELRILCEEGNSANWSEVAHHYLAAEALPEAIHALEMAAQLALAQLAFDDAVKLTEQALASLPQRTEPRRRAELLLLMAHARLRAGAITSGRAACYEAARIAEQIGDATLLTRAALESGSVYVFAKVDKRQVALLQEALHALPQDETAQRAEVSARLAAALQPSTQPDQPIALAREAIRLARTQDDDALVLRVLRSAVSALMDIGPATERLPLNREYAQLAEKLNLLSDLWRARCRLIFDHFELGQIEGSYESLSHVVALAERLDHPDYIWRATAMRTMTATFRGRLKEAHTLLQQTTEVASSGRDPNWPRTRCTLQLALHRAQGQRLPEELVEEITKQFPDEGLAEFYIWSDWASHGQLDQLRGAVAPESLELALASGDSGLLQDLCTVAVALKDDDLLQRTYTALLPQAKRFVSGGMTALTWEPPLGRGLGLIALALGRTQEGIEHLEHALDETQRAGSRCYAVWLQLDLAKAQIAAGAPERALELLQAANQGGRAISLTTAVEASDKLLAALSTEQDAPPPSFPSPVAVQGFQLKLELEGELWRLQADSHSHRLANTKGIRLLAELVAEPGREFHVLELERQSAAQVDVPRTGMQASTANFGSAGAALDETARRQYRERIQELRHEIDQADDLNDRGRAEMLNSELDALTRELSRAFGLGGRSRPVASAAERARINIQRRLKDAIKRVRAVAPDIARQLERSIRTGTYCVYDP